MDPTIIVDLLSQYGPTLVFLAVTMTALVYVVRLLLKVLTERAERAESLVDTFKPSIDALTAATEAHTDAIKEHTAQGVTQTAVLNALLEEWRRQK